MTITTLFILFFTTIFLMSKMEIKMHLLIFSVFILPFFYDYFPILPNSTKLITDVYLSIFFLFVFISDKLILVIKYNKISVFLFIYVTIFLAVITLSSITNNSSVILVLLETRKVVFPLMIVCLFNYYEILKKKQYDFERVLKYIFILQAVLIPIQYVFYDIYSKYMVKEMIRIDAASGTFGIGTSMIGVFIVLYFIYTFMKFKKMTSFFTLVPLPFVFSGGSNVLLIGATCLALFVKRLNKKMIRSMLAGVVVIIFLGVVSSLCIFDRNPIIDSYEYVSRGTERTLTKKEMFTHQTNKLSRLYGPIYAVQELSRHNKEILGFGTSVYATSTSLGISTNPFDIGEIINLVPELLLKYGYSGLLVNIVFYMFLIGYFFRKRKINNYYAISFIFSVVYLLNFMYTKPIYQPVFNCFVFFIYYKACSLEKAAKIHNEKSIYSNPYVQTPVKT